MNAPHWSLRLIKNLAASGSFILSQTKAVAFFDSKDEAYATAAEQIAKLTAMNFSHVKQQADACDVYGVVIDGVAWYLKVTVQAKSTLFVMSLHPATGPIKTNGGIVY
jgi:hypothetical protein